MLAAKENENQMMEMEEIEAILEKIWDLHDKLSDAIHSISRTHFLSTIKTLKCYSSSDRPKKKHINHLGDAVLEENGRNGYVFMKEFRNEDEDVELAVQEAKSLNAIRTALEHLEDQLEFFHTVQVQQRAERDAAIARLEQSRIVLAIRLAEHHGKKYQVIEEALAFVGDVNNSGAFVSPLESPSGDKFVSHGEKRWDFLNKALVSLFNFAKNSLRMDHIGGILGNAALVACSMLALVHLQQVAYKDNFDQEHLQRREYNIQGTRNTRKAIGVGGSPSDYSAQLDVLLARG